MVLMFRNSIESSNQFIWLPFLSDPDYKKFLEYYNGDEEKFTSTPETLLEEIEAKTKELVGMYAVLL